MYDKTRLTRDYTKYPVQAREPINREDLAYLYEQCSMTIPEMRKVLGVDLSKLYKFVNKYQLTKYSNVSLPTDILDKVDFNRLSRDYCTQPLKSQEMPPKEDLEYLFLELDLPHDKISQLFGRGNSVGFSRKACKLYGITKRGAYAWEKQRRLYKERTGYNSPLENPVVREKIKKTCKERYGVENRLQDPEYQKHLYTLWTTPEKLALAKQKRTETNLERYGVQVPTQCPEVKAKFKNTFLTKYGAQSYPQSLMPKEVLNTLSNKETLKNVIQNSKYKNYRRLAQEIGCDDTTLKRYIVSYGLVDLVSPTDSSYERDIRSIFSSIPLRKDRKVLDGMEIDLYSEEHKVGIEFNGNYWHSEAHKDKYYHKDKSAQAAAKGVFLFHIFEYEWNDPRTKEAIVHRLQHLFMQNKTKVAARKCVVKEVPQSEARAFLDANHVQGQTLGKVRLGLYYQAELVCLMEFVDNGINKNYQWELNRLCTKFGYNVQGGASKLLKYFIKNYSPESIVSYSDIAKTRGGIYKTLGFKHVATTAPQYHWTDGEVTLSRYKTQRKRLIRAGWLSGKEDPRSEATVMQEHGFWRIYDCGKKVWALQFKGEQV